MMDQNTARNKLIAASINDGKVYIPEAVLSELNIKDGENILFLKRGSSWIITTRDKQIEEGLAYFRSHNPDRKSLVDDLIAERREEH